MTSVITLAAHQCGALKPETFQKIQQFTIAFDVLTAITCLIVGILGACSVIGVSQLLAGALMGYSVAVGIGFIPFVIDLIKGRPNNDVYQAVIEADFEQESRRRI